MSSTEAVPQHIGELSRYALQKAISTVDRALADAPQEVRDAVSVIRLVANMPRRTPWYGQVVDPEDSSVTVGVMMRNAFEALGDAIEVPTGRGLETSARHWLTQRYLPLWRALTYLTHLFCRTPPIAWEYVRNPGRRAPDSP